MGDFFPRPVKPSPRLKVRADTNSACGQHTSGKGVAKNDSPKMPMIEIIV
jgi:hypothetical protein